MSLAVPASQRLSCQPIPQRCALPPTRPNVSWSPLTASFASRPLACYATSDGRTRELIAIPGHAGSVLVLDRDATTLCDRRLVAHLATDEPSENAQLVCHLYLADSRGRWCRSIEPADLEVAPFTTAEDSSHVDYEDRQTPILDCHGNAYQLRVLPGERSGSQLRWCRLAPHPRRASWEQVGLREVVASLQSYEPMRTLTERALARHRASRRTSVSLARLDAELERLTRSPIVLNRRLREAVLEAIRTRRLSMSEVAHRCGMVKCDRRGRLSGETSWLARRIGIMPEGGNSVATPWVHSDVLGLIAREGLGLSPREVEL